MPPVLAPLSTVYLLETVDIFGYVEFIVANDPDSSTIWYSIVGMYLTLVLLVADQV